MSNEVRVAVLASGSGTNLQALLDADLTPAKVVLVVSNNPGARALDRARAAQTKALLVDHRQFGTREAFDEAVVAQLRAYAIDWVVLAGFMRLITPVFLEAFKTRIVNVHPSLLPAFPGVNAQAQALRAGVKVTGCSIHLVDAGIDTGPILAQAAVPIGPDDQLIDVQRRILAQEHRLLPAVVRALASGGLEQDDHGRFRLAEMSPELGEVLTSPRFGDPTT